MGYLCYYRKILVFWLFSTSLTLLAADSAELDKMAAPFPKGFLFGTAVAGFQVDMGCPTLAPKECEDRASDWYQFVTDPYFKLQPLLFLSGDKLSGGPGFYETYREDVQNAREDLGNNAMRVSIEWSRIFPEPTFGIEGYDALRNRAAQGALDYYHQLFAVMREHHIKPIVTLNHYTLPLWIHNAKHSQFNMATSPAKGWLDSRIVGEIAKYAGFVAEEFGDEVDTWATLNEPFNSVVIPGYVFPSQPRSNPPGLGLHLDAARQAMVNMIEAHAAMYDAIHLVARQYHRKAAVGLVNVYFAVDGASSDAKDQQAAQDFSYFTNDMFNRPLLKGELDRKWDGHIESRPDLLGKLDFLGVNYYVRFTVKNATIPGESIISPFLHINPFELHTDENYPQGIYTVIAALKPYHLPIIITETGVDATRDPAIVGSWLVRTLAYTRKAIADGHDVRGYMYWSLMDNFEWNHGYNLRFGLYKVDPKDPSKKRVPRAAVGLYGEITGANAISRELLSTYLGTR